jgi:ABC-type branched-subunit amino acid transport system substrate-binding protein
MKLLVCLLSAALVAACAHGGSTEGGGVRGPSTKVEAKQSQTADQALAQAVQSAQTAPKAKAVEIFLAVRKAYPETTAGQEALYRAGTLLYDLGHYARARQSFNELLFENPLYEKAPQAKKKLALSALRLGAYRDAYQTLTSLAERAEGPEKQELLDAAARAAQGAGLSLEALKMAIERVEKDTEPEAHEAALAHLTEVVETNAGFPDIAQALENMPPTHPAWPLLTFKAARVYYHLRDWDRLQTTLQQYLQQAPGHAYVAEAKAMLARAERRVAVSPKTLGVVLPLSGKYKLVGEGVLRAIQLALKDSDIELVVKDTQGDPYQSAQAVEALAFESGAVAILGSFLADDARRAALVAEELGVPIVSLSQAEGITDIGPHVFRNMLTQSAQANALAEYSTKVLGYKTFAVLYPSTPYGEELANLFWDAVIARGGVVRGAEQYSFDQTTFTSEVKKLVGRYYLEDRGDYLKGIQELKDLDAFHRRKAVEKLKGSLLPVVDFEALFIPDNWQQVGLLAPALAVEDVITNACDPRDLEKIRKTTKRKDLKTVTLLGSNRWSSPKGRTGVPELVERGGKFVTCSVYVDGFFADSSRAQTRRFVKQFSESAPDNRTPTLLEASAYDSALLLRQVLSPGTRKTRDQVRDALAATKNFDGVTGKTSFNAHREAEKPLFFITLESNGIRELGPAEKVGS